MAQWWKTHPWRMIQTNLREIDMLDMDAAQYAAELQKFGATVALFNAGGIIANYASRLEFEPENLYRRADSADEILAACHAAGIRVIARTDFSKITEHVYCRHPEWAYRDRAGKIVNYNGYVQTCPNGGYQQKCMPAIITEMLGEHAFDGIFFNMGGFRTRDYSYAYYGACHCAACRAKFRERYGHAIPREENSEDPCYQKYRAFIRDCRAEHEERIVRHIRALRDDVAIDGVDFQRVESNTELVRFRALPAWQYSASSNTRCARDEERGIVASNTSVDFIGFPYRHVAVSPAQQELRLWQNLANLGGLDYYLIGRLDNHRDTSGYGGVKKVFRFAKDHERDFAGLRSAAKVLLVRDDIWGDAAEIRGWIRALTEAHIPFDERLYETIDSAAMLSRYSLVILPDIRFVSSKLAGLLDGFAAKGGVVLATGEAGMHDDVFAPRAKPALACLGVEELLFRESGAGVLSAMLEVTKADAEAFPSFVRAGASFAAIGEAFLRVRMRREAKGFLRYIPPHAYGPPECCYYTDVTDIPGVFVHPHGRGRGVYVPWLPGAFYYREGHENPRMFMTDVLLSLCGAESSAPGLTPMVEVTLSRGEGRIVVQFVNTSGHFGGSYFAPLPVRDLDVVLGGVAPASVETLNGGTAGFRMEGGRAVISLDVLHDYEAVVVRV